MFENWLPHNDPFLLGLYGAIVVTGLVNCFVGFRIFKYALGITLALAGAAAGAVVADRFAAGDQTYLLAGIGVGAVLGLIISFVFVKVAAAIAGGLLGYALLAPNLVGLEDLVRYGVLIGGCIFGAAIGVFLANPVITLAMAFFGAFQVVYGALFFIDGTQILLLHDDPVAGWQVLSSQQIPFIIMMVLGALGAYYQFTAKRRRRRKSED